MFKEMLLGQLSEAFMQRMAPVGLDLNDAKIAKFDFILRDTKDENRVHCVSYLMNKPPDSWFSQFESPRIAWMSWVANYQEEEKVEELDFCIHINANVDKSQVRTMNVDDHELAGMFEFAERRIIDITISLI